jgi:hypothetical protein
MTMIVQVSDFVLIGFMIAQFCLIWHRLGRLEGMINGKINCKGGKDNGST